MIKIEEIAKSLEFPFIVEQLNKIIREEQKKRSVFNYLIVELLFQIKDYLIELKKS
jgi:hypothetical protein